MKGINLENLIGSRFDDCLDIVTEKGKENILFYCSIVNKNEHTTETKYKVGNRLVADTCNLSI